MSRAFVKEQEDSESFDTLPDRVVSPHPNFVTAEGLAAIEAELSRAQSEFDAAQAAGDRALAAKAARDVRYFTSRRTSAQVIAPPKNSDRVQFGSTVTIERADGRHQTFRIVGEDEADPAQGTLSHASPLARALAGKNLGDAVQAGNIEAEILAIE
ncbi:MAG: transcription elongation factor GreA [Hyphomicrobiales bacterium]|nr:transcription elongation factor GreA [Hyphomicrobiales bacterium]MBV9111451.1 transcription elongation factor GreA [Hyphomicrobiales bacterium]MBV9517468.1 transcription elongation factor GreA [Hyphomicrobiales bacterium]